MNRLNVKENEDKHVRNIAMKVVGHKNCQVSSDDSDGDQDQEEIEVEDQGQKEVESEVEEAQEVISLPRRLTRSKFKELGSSGRLFSLFIMSFV